MVTVTVDLKPKVYEALKTISEAFGVSIEELVGQGALAEAEGFLQDPAAYTDGIVESVKKILEA